MKSVIRVLFLVFFTIPAFGAVGTHNLVAVFNLGANLGFIDNHNNDDTYAQKGFSLGFDVGYQYYGGKGLVVHGNDVVVGLRYGFDKGYKLNGAELPASFKYGVRPLLGTVSSTYSLGFHALKTRFMFDIIGLQFVFGERHAINKTGGTTVKEVLKPNFGMGFNLPLGFRVVLDMGFVIGFRHSYTFFGPVGSSPKGTVQHHYNINALIGFSFGGGAKKQ